VRIIYRAGFLVIAILLIVFAVSNRETVSVGFWPLPFLADVPLYLLCFLSLLIGALIGSAVTWTAGHRNRRELRARRRRIEALERELTATQSQIEHHPATGEDAATRYAAIAPSPQRRRVSAHQ
jgi:uncharacterized integral membrane protein